MMKNIRFDKLMCEHLHVYMYINRQPVNFKIKTYLSNIIITSDFDNIYYITSPTITIFLDNMMLFMNIVTLEHAYDNISNHRLFDLEKDIMHKRTCLIRSYNDRI